MRIGVLGRGDKVLMDVFNKFIESANLREIKKIGSRFTWTNKQECPIMSNIDRVLVSTEWEDSHPLTSPRSITRIGSDHWPLLLDTGGPNNIKKRQFYFERQWMQVDGFTDLVRKRWLVGRGRYPENAYSLDKWHGNISMLRKFLKGWGDNMRGGYRRQKENLL